MIQTVTVSIAKTNADNGGRGKNARLTFTLRPVQASLSNYWIEVAGEDGATGTYRLRVSDVPHVSVSEPDGEDFPADDTTTGRVTVSGSATGNIATNGDIDAFAVQLEVGHTYQIEMEGV